jgi:membrane fusion protein (multidrug efflux system)
MTEMTPQYPAPKRKPSLTKRMVIMLILIGLLLGGIIGFNVFKGIMMKKFMGSSTEPPQAVSTMKAELQEWQPQLNAVGSLRAVRGVDVTSEIAGLVRELKFKSGDEVKAGQVLVQLNADADVAQLRALEAAAELAATVLARDKAQLAVEVVSQAQVDSDTADLKSKRAQVAQQRALVDKKTIRAPFAGRLGITIVNPGQYVNPGDKIVTLQTIDPIYIDFSLPQQQLANLKTGQAVAVTNDAYAGQAFPGIVNAINPQVDTGTRNVLLEATIQNPKRQLLPGMFGNVAVDVGEKQRYLTLPQTVVTYNPYGATVFLAQSSKDKKDEKGNPLLEAQQVFVTAGPTRGDQVAILKGVEAGQTVVTSGQVKLKNGTPLKVDNRVQPSNNPSPKPQEQ